MPSNHQFQLQQKIALLYWTFLDFHPFILHGNYGRISFLAFNKMFHHYQKIRARILTQQIKFYVMGTAIDQGIIDLTKQYTQQQINLLIKQQNKVEEDIVSLKNEKSKGQSLQNKEQRIQMIIEKKFENIKKLNYFGLISYLEEQYYRQRLTYQRVKQQFERNIDFSRHKNMSPKDLGFYILQAIGKKNHNYILLGDILKFVSKTDGGSLRYCIKKMIKDIKNCQYLNILKNKLCNNAHTQVKHLRTTKLIKKQIDQIQINIENIIELLYRVADPEKSLTFSFIQKIINSLEKNEVQKMEKQTQITIKKQRNELKKQILLSQLKIIENAAKKMINEKNDLSQIYSKSKPKFSPIHKENKSYQQIRQCQFNSPKNIYINQQRIQAKTHRQQPDYLQTHQQTYRRKINIESDTKQTEIKKNNSKQKNIRDSSSKQSSKIGAFQCTVNREYIRERVAEQLQKIRVEKQSNRQKFQEMFGF